jgi:hypothetical protein
MTSWLLGLSVTAFALSLVTAHGIQRQFLNADHIMYSIMSLDQVTLFYWGQNRFLSVIPFLASTISDPYLNLLTVTALSALSHLLCLTLLYATAKQLLLRRSVSLRELAPGTLLLWGLTFVLLEPAALYTMLQHHEYSLAISMLLAAWLLVMRASSAKSTLATVLEPVFAGLLMLLALGVNPSLVVLGFALVLLKVILRGGWRHERFVLVLWLAGLTTAFSFWYLIMNRQEDEQRYFSIRWNEITQGFELGISSFINQFEPIVVLVLLVTMTWLAIITARKSQVHVRPQVLAAAAFVAVFAVVWVLGFSTIEWIFENDHHPRYFLPATYLVLLVTALALGRLVQMRMKVHPAMFSLLGLLLIGSLVFKAPLSNNLLTAPVFEALPKVDSRALILAGDYWDVWPQYFLLKTEGEVPVSLAYRSKAIAEYFRVELKQMLADTQPATAWCISSSSSRCERQLRSYLGNAIASDFIPINSKLQQFSITWDAN